MRELNPDVPAWFDAVVLKLLTKSAAGRFESAEQLAGIFEECLGHLQQPTACPLPLAVRELMPEKHSGLIPAPWRLLSAIILFVTGIVVVWQYNQRDEVPKLNPGPDVPSAETPQPPWEDGVEEDLKWLDMELDSLLEQTTPL